MCIYTSMGGCFYAQNPQKIYMHKSIQHSFNHHIRLCQCGALRLEKTFIDRLMMQSLHSLQWPLSQNKTLKITWGIILKKFAPKPVLPKNIE